MKILWTCTIKIIILYHLRCLYIMQHLVCPLVSILGHHFNQTLQCSHLFLLAFESRLTPFTIFIEVDEGRIDLKGLLSIFNCWSFDDSIMVLTASKTIFVWDIEIENETDHWYDCPKQCLSIFISFRVLNNVERPSGFILLLLRKH